MESRSLCEEPDSKSSLPFPSPPDSDLGEDTETEGCGRDRDREDMFPGGQEHRDQDRSYSESSSPVDVIVTTDSKDIPDDLTSTNSKDGSHVVKWTVSIVIAIPKGEEACPVGEAMVLVEKAKKKPKRVLSGGVVEAPKAQTYYRIEYNMLPGDQDPVKVDLVMFGLAAKIYMENETKVLKPWLEGDQVWLGWSQSVKVRVTRELLIKLVSHKITFKIWDTKDRVSAKARYDRPKTFRLPQAKPGEDNDLGGIKSMVYKLRTMFEKKNPRTRSSNKRGDTLSTDFKRFSELNCVTDQGNRTCSQSTQRVPNLMAQWNRRRRRIPLHQNQPRRNQPWTSLPKP
uniref:Si:dkey-57n24.6 n=1 Tax=Oncorhynchus kisutch TaxID=8019 RepID=A0A8C7MMB0_ONCKI